MGSLHNVQQKWVPEIEHHAPGVPLVLVGTKADLREDENTKRQLKSKNMDFVQQDDIERVKTAIKAETYIECSALTQEGLKSVFDEAIRAALRPKKKKKAGGCNLL